MVIDPEDSTLGVLTVMYKPTAAERKKYGFDCGTPPPPFNGDPKTGCLGGEWFYGFYKVQESGSGDSIRISCQNDNFGKWLNTQVNQSAGSFCVACHVTGFKTNYLRILYDQLRDPKTPQGMPVVKSVSVPPCDGSLTYGLPGDVPVRPLSVWKSDNGSEQSKKMFDCFSWQTFVALNWPADPSQRGQPDKNKSIKKPGKSPTVWQTYMPVYGTFQAGDLDWKPPAFQDPPVVDGPGCDVSEGQMLISLASKARDVIDETGQANAGTFGDLVDRNGNQAHYEVLINEVEYDYIVDNDAALTKNLTSGGPANLTKVDFPDGSIEIKTGWKVLCPQPGEDNACSPPDDPANYFTAEALLYDASTKSCSKPTLVGLIAMHIAYKTFWAPQWVWATFSHNTNAPTAGGQSELSSDIYSFYDPNLKPPAAAPPCTAGPFLISPKGCPNVVINRFGDRPQTGLPSFLPDAGQPNQITRLVAQDAPAAAINKQFREALSGTVWKNYILLDAQWPLHGQGGTPDKPMPIMTVCDQKPNNIQVPLDEIKVGKNCFAIVPPVLRNPVAESYMSTYVQDEVTGNPAQISNRGCLNCHRLAPNGSYVWLDGAAHAVPVKTD